MLSLATQSCSALELLDHRVERAVHMIGGAEIAQPSMRLGVQSLMERGDQPRLADARFARQQHCLALSCPSLLPALKQKLEFLRPPYKRRRNAMQRIKAALCIGLASNAPGADRSCETLELPLAEIDHVKQSDNQPLCAVGDHDGVRLGQGLQACRQVGRLADDGLLLR